MTIKSETRHGYRLDGVWVELVNCPIRGSHHALQQTAEAWLQYARETYGDVTAFTTAWDEFGRVTHNVEFSQEALGVATGNCKGTAN